MSRNKRLRQTTLFDAIHSSGNRVSSSSRHPSSSSPVRSTSVQRRRVVSTPEATTSDSETVSRRRLQPTPSTSLKRQRVKSARNDSSTSGSDASRRKLQPIRSITQDNDSDLDGTPPSKKRKTTGRMNVVSSDASDSEQTYLPVRRSTARKPILLSSSDESERNTVVRQVRKGERRRSPSLVARSSDSEELANEVDSEYILDQRLRSRSKKTAFQKNLEKLKRKKHGLAMSSSDDEASSENLRAPSPKERPFPGSRPDDDSDVVLDEEQQSDSDNFIVEDEGEKISLPAAFSMESKEDLSFQFKKIFQFFVHIAVHLPADRSKFMASQMKSEEYFSAPLEYARRVLYGMRDSLVASSVWRADFKKALEVYPNLSLTQLDFAVLGCDACYSGVNRRKSTVMAVLGGNRYNRIGFEADECSSNSSDSDGSQSDEDFRFHLGRFCARRTKIYHDLTHWEYVVFQVILRQLDSLRATADGNEGFVPVQFAGRPPPEDLEDADGICEWLDDRHVIDFEWRRLKEVMNKARNLEHANRNGDDDDLFD